MDNVAFSIGPALLAGVISTVVVLVLLMVTLAVTPTRFPLNPLYLIGSAFSIDTTAAYGLGLGVLLIVGAAYGGVVSAVCSGFHITEFEFLWGALTGVVLSIVTGTTLAYARSLNRAVRSGQIGDPGPFLIRYGPWSVAQLVFSHVLLGTVAGAVYATLV
jgi:hypothetical protein